MLASSRSRSPLASKKNSPTEPPPITYHDLSPVGRAVAGTVEIGFTTVLEYCSGFFGGYVLGSLTDIPRLLTLPVEPNVQQAFFRELSGRAARMHLKSFEWAMRWGGISAAFGGFRVATKVFRGGVEDEWNTVISSMAAGAFFARAGQFNLCLCENG
jgi:Tim17/Tim22/Tim23/Pmp24 family